MVSLKIDFLSVILNQIRGLPFRPTDTTHSDYVIKYKDKCYVLSMKIREAKDDCNNLPHYEIED